MSRDVVFANSDALKASKSFTCTRPGAHQNTDAQRYVVTDLRDTISVTILLLCCRTKHKKRNLERTGSLES